MSAITFDWPAQADETKDERKPETTRSVLDWIQRRIAIFRHRKLLHALSDSVLADIGINREQIDWIVADRLDYAGRPRGPYPF